MLKKDWDGLTYTVNGSNNGLYKSTLQDLITEAYNAGITVVAAAGNFNTDRTCFPAANDYVIGVGSTGLNDNDAKAGYSNYGSYVDVCAPGYVVAPHSSSDSAYCVTWGTSFSAPLVSGAIALYKSKYPSATPAQIEVRLKATCDPLNYTGSGWSEEIMNNFRDYASISQFDCKGNRLSDNIMLFSGNRWRPSVLPRQKSNPLISQRAATSILLSDPETLPR